MGGPSRPGASFVLTVRACRALAIANTVGARTVGSFQNSRFVAEAGLEPATSGE